MSLLVPLMLLAKGSLLVIVMYYNYLSVSVPHAQLFIFLCNLCRIKGKQAISCYHNFLFTNRLNTTDLLRGKLAPKHIRHSIHVACGSQSSENTNIRFPFSISLA
jgi:hypothetical protein